MLVSTWGGRLKYSLGNGFLASVPFYFICFPSLLARNAAGGEYHVTFWEAPPDDQVLTSLSELPGVDATIRRLDTLACPGGASWGLSLLVSFRCILWAGCATGYRM